MKHTQSPKGFLITTTMSVDFGNRTLNLALTYNERRDFFRTIKNALEHAYDEGGSHDVRWIHPIALDADDVVYLNHHLNEIRELVKDCESAYTLDFEIKLGDQGLVWRGTGSPSNGYAQAPHGYTVVWICEPEGTLCSAVEGMDEILDEVEEDENHSDSDDEDQNNQPTGITG